MWLLHNATDKNEWQENCTLPCNHTWCTLQALFCVVPRTGVCKISPLSVKTNTPWPMLIIIIIIIIINPLHFTCHGHLNIVPTSPKTQCFYDRQNTAIFSITGLSIAAVTGFLDWYRLCTCKCRFTHTMPFPCRSAKALDCVFPIWFTQCGRVWFTYHAVPLPCHEYVFLKATS
jgi:hypothetical protein